ncbi:molybdenum cofactor guanylyltransferase [Candidatus Methylopumilus planktonicus]|uniref:molybdenum cofactor guanylyltransferase MobA n=1 Tax=Candidatus Methylopumilus TaxID=1679002 RepID=UPI0011208B60|nr:molybdenum cofactor guanylyltransferase MobA [Candidatus Methylopumilus planktonicus]QDD00745.1 molybdenum cofactor guanylyltransferase [Candidatus Methylopumilus planktonicus]QDD02075.1 molybdenum cofactor guanylyltransferase [Candidatus Methylopumilus planktonicus]QDD07338.1 molybdenum cofactor guanylyltransferase [Candidatus Methylopumilus planktonicus]QDD08667.1 molybdenum cofactor guanylyltransferase [Candidatus Methylopumilus planktonicus]QDD09990.1 molybdenum cofactor guanylyltransfe
MNHSVTVVILAGGQSKRMQVQNKATVLLEGKPLITHVIDRMKTQAKHTVINTHRNQKDFEIFHLPLIDDILDIQEGPLLGILTSLQAIKTDWIQFVPCDTPNLPNDLIAILMEEVEAKKTLVAVPETSDGLQSTCLLCHSSTLNNLQIFFNQGGRKIEDWIRQLAFSIVQFNDESQFLNVNTQEELKKAYS